MTFFIHRVGVAGSPGVHAVNQGSWLAGFRGRPNFYFKFYTMYTNHGTLKLSHKKLLSVAFKRV